MAETTTPKRAKTTEADVCRECGSESLFSGWFNRDDLAVDDDRIEVGVRWTTWCNDCGTEQA